MSASGKKTNIYMVGIVLAVLTFWLFAQSMINVLPAMTAEMDVSLSTLNIATSLTALFSGLFIVVAGGMADRSGRKKMTFIGLGLSILGSGLIVIAQEPTILIIGRAIQGISAACIMPATIALIKTAFDDKDRQRALSYWSFGSWGGGGVATLAGGLIATTLGWRWIFVISILVALIAMWILRDIQESKVNDHKKEPFDYVGFVLFIFLLLGANVVVTQGQELGWGNPVTIGITIATLILIGVFLSYEKKRKHQFIDFNLFKSKAYTGAVTSNFLMNGVIATVVVANTYGQLARGFSSFETGLLTIGNIIALLTMIRVGERLLQKLGARKPMIWATFIGGFGMSLAGMTMLPDTAYVIVVFIGFLISGFGVGMYATPSMDTALVHVNDDKAGVASGIYKMASSLGYSFGLAISTAVFTTVQSITANLHIAGTVGMLTPFVFGLLALWIVSRTISPTEGLETSKNVQIQS